MKKRRRKPIEDPEFLLQFQPSVQAQSQVPAWYARLKVLAFIIVTVSTPPFQSSYDPSNKEGKNLESYAPRGAVIHCHWISPQKQTPAGDGYVPRPSDEDYSLLFPDLDTCGNPAPLQLHRFKMRRNLAGLCGCSGDDSLRCKVGSSPSGNALLDRLLFTRCIMFPREIRRACV